MKAIYKSLWVLIAVFFLGFASCTEDTETCKAKDFSNSYETTFNLSVKVVYEDGTPYNGEVSYTIYKVYCDGNANGKYVQTGVTNPNTGYWHPPVNRIYRYTNPDDRVDVDFEVKNQVSFVDTWSESEVSGLTMITRNYTYTIKK